MSALIELEDSVFVLLQLQEDAKKNGKSAVKDRYMAAKCRRDLALKRAQEVIKQGGQLLEREAFAARKQANKESRPYAARK
jgi:hypothetical protein